MCVHSRYEELFVHFILANIVKANAKEYKRGASSKPKKKVFYI
jgi:hypothetical protein